MFPYHKHVAKVVAALDRLSRERALSDAESSLLEHFIKLADGRLEPGTRLPHRGNVVLARLGLKRDQALERASLKPNKRARDFGVDR